MDQHLAAILRRFCARNLHSRSCYMLRRFSKLLLALTGCRADVEAHHSATDTTDPEFDQLRLAKPTAGVHILSACDQIIAIHRFKAWQRGYNRKISALGLMVSGKDACPSFASHHHASLLRLCTAQGFNMAEHPKRTSTKQRQICLPGDIASQKKTKLRALHSEGLFSHYGCRGLAPQCLQLALPISFKHALPTRLRCAGLAKPEIFLVSIGR